MINFDAVNFSERRSEEVISFFWRSVYVMIPFVPLKSEIGLRVNRNKNCEEVVGSIFSLLVVNTALIQKNNQKTQSNKDGYKKKKQNWSGAENKYEEFELKNR